MSTTALAVGTPLESPEEFITLQRAAELSGVAYHTLLAQARPRRASALPKLRVDRRGPRAVYTTRLWLHDYLVMATRNNKSKRKPLPEGYVAPE